MGDSADCIEMLKAGNSVRGHVMAWHDTQAIQEYLKELMTISNSERKEYGTVMLSKVIESSIDIRHWDWGGGCSLQRSLGIDYS